MTPIEKAVDTLFSEHVQSIGILTNPDITKSNLHFTVKIAITAFLDAILADPEAMERVSRVIIGYRGLSRQAVPKEIIEDRKSVV